MMSERLTASGFAGLAHDYFSDSEENDDPFLERAFSKSPLNSSFAAAFEPRRPMDVEGTIVAKWTYALPRRKPRDGWRILAALRYDSTQDNQYIIEQPAPQEAEEVALPDEAGESQLELWSSREFVPSNRLIEFWQDGLRFYATEQLQLRRAHIGDRLDSATLKKEFSEQLHATLVEELRALRSKDRQEFPLFEEDTGEFIRPLESRFSNFLPIKPREIGAFLEQLSREIAEHFAKGSAVRGRWGEIRYRSGKIYVVLTPSEPIAYPKATKKVLNIEL